MNYIFLLDFVSFLEIYNLFGIIITSLSLCILLTFYNLAEFSSEFELFFSNFGTESIFCLKATVVSVDKSVKFEIFGIIL